MYFPIQIDRIIDVTGPGGNTFALVSTVSGWIRQYGMATKDLDAAEEAIKTMKDRIFNDAKSYGEVLDILREYVTVEFDLGDEEYDDDWEDED